MSQGTAGSLGVVGAVEGIAIPWAPPLPIHLDVQHIELPIIAQEVEAEVVQPVPTRGNCENSGVNVISARVCLVWLNKGAYQRWSCVVEQASWTKEKQAEGGGGGPSSCSIHTDETMTTRMMTTMAWWLR